MFLYVGIQYLRYTKKIKSPLFRKRGLALFYRNIIPATAAFKKLASVPAITALIPNCAICLRRVGANVPVTPN